MPKQQWNDHQLAIYKHIRDQDGHLVIRARAGTGKTTTSIEAMRHMEGSVAALAFGHEIAKELERRVPSNVEARTFHSFGLRALTKAYPRRYKVSAGSASKKFTERLKASQAAGKRLTVRPWALGHVMARAIEILKANLIPPEDLGGIDAALDSIDLDVPKDFTRAEWIEYLSKALADDLAGVAVGGTVEIDFADMIWLPVVLDVRFPLFDNVIADEAQDLTRAQHQIALRSCKKRGRIIAVGDDRQAIYAFRGADQDSMNRLIERLKAPVLPLPVCYRCPRDVIKAAQRFVPDIQWHPDAEAGRIIDSAPVESAEFGDVVISRTNAELVTLCLRWLGQGKPTTIVGNQMLQSLKRFVEGSKASSTVELLRYTAEWSERETERLRLRERSTTHIEDRKACISALSRHSSDVGELIRLLDNISTPAEGRSVILTSAHRAKGLEFNNTYLLQHTFDRVRQRAAQRGGRVLDEDNLQYVAITRARKTMTLATMEPVSAEENEQ